MVAQGEGIPLDNAEGPTTTATIAPTNAIIFSTGANGEATQVITDAVDPNVIASIGPNAPGTTSTGAPTATNTALITAAPTSSSQASSSSAPSHSSGLPLSTLLPAVIVPVVILLIAIPALIFYWFHRRNKKLEREQRRISTPDLGGPPTSEALLHKQSQPSFGGGPFSDGENSATSTFAFHEKQNSNGGDHGEAIALNARNSERSWDRDESPQKKPSPTLPSPMVTKRPERPERPKNRPTTQEAWPLPAHSNLPDPDVMSIASSNKPLPAVKSQNDSFNLPPVQFSAPFSMHDSIATDSSLYDLSSSAANFPEPPQSLAARSRGVTDSVEIFNPARHERESVVSELSNPGDVAPARSPRSRRDTDAVSLVSAMTNRSRSQRRKSTTSVVSALSPEEPELPMQSFPLR